MTLGGRILIALSGSCVLLLARPHALASQYAFVPSPPQCPAPAAPKRTPRSAAVRVGVLSLHLERANAEQRYLADAFADLLARRLASLERISLFAPHAVRRVAPASASNARHVARELGTRFLVTGTLTSRQGTSRIDLVMFDTLASDAVWRRSFDADARTLAGALEPITVALATLMLPALTASEQTSLATPLTSSTEAFEKYLRGLDAAREYTMGHKLRAVALFGEAVAADAAFAEAHTALSLTLSSMLDGGAREAMVNPDSIVQLARTHAERAVTLDAKSARAWNAKGTALSFTPSRWADARAAFARAVELDPRDPEIRQHSGRALLRMGLRREADAAFQAAFQASPSYAPAFAALGDLALGERRTESACSWLNAAIVADPYAPLPYALRAIARRREKDMRLAWSDAEIATRLGLRASGEAAYALVDATDGDSIGARGIALKLFREFDRRSRLGVTDARLSALALASVGENARAVSLLERAYPRDGLLGLMLADPAFAPLRSDVRFLRIRTAIDATLAGRSGRGVASP